MEENVIHTLVHHKKIVRVTKRTKKDPEEDYWNIKIKLTIEKFIGSCDHKNEINA